VGKGLPGLFFILFCIRGLFPPIITNSLSEKDWSFSGKILVFTSDFPPFLDGMRTFSFSRTQKNFLLLLAVFSASNVLGLPSLLIVRSPFLYNSS